MKPSVAFLLFGLATHEVTATWNRRAGRFNTPQYNNNECTDRQREGYNWLDIPQGDISDYEDFNFRGGWKCAESFGKRDALTKRTFNSKCIKNRVARDRPAAFDCKAKRDGFSVREIQVSVEYDTDLIFHYKMPDNTICKQTSRCKKEGTIVQNTQCGGAREVEVYLGNHNEGDREDCEIGFHHIDFDCTPPYTPIPPESPPAEEPSSPPEELPEETPTPPTEGTPAPPVEETPAPPVEETPAPPVEETPSPPATETPSPSSVSPPTYGNDSYSALPPVDPTATSTQSVVLPPSETPESSTPPSLSTTSDVPVLPSSTTDLPVESPSTVSPTPSGTPESSPPECLPKCMNTWLEINSQCKDNTDSDCYCKNPEFTKSVIECVAAWSTDDETQQALQYLLGICASHVPENPGLITDCPTNVPINPTPPPEAPVGPSTTADSSLTTAAPESSIVANPPEVPVTTITFETTIEAPCSCAESTTETSTFSTTITVPQVIFITQTPAQPPAPGATPSDVPVDLVPGTPPSVPAETTLAPYPTASGVVPTSLGTVVVPSASATFSVPPEFEGTASGMTGGFASALLGAVLAVFAF
ncbi:hypothetical protein M011DRAFT_493955 [Sporormia fimetaria CBS 119925]|uniref:CFEM domain-containing protein n=1 Tax=Sporormia fimetaria CBS 119925 TaxID=1340428 RepID=A0A6A6VBV5_9PLEO|nr:hypothetical protein M011DRAFT_493955 [Sporormia fimetaria CBS 119925]